MDQATGSPGQRTQDYRLKVERDLIQLYDAKQHTTTEIAQFPGLSRTSLYRQLGSSARDPIRSSPTTDGALGAVTRRSRQD